MYDSSSVIKTDDSALKLVTKTNRFGSPMITNISKMFPLLTRNELESLDSCDTLHIYMLNQQFFNKKVKMLEHKLVAVTHNGS